MMITGRRRVLQAVAIAGTALAFSTASLAQDDYKWPKLFVIGTPGTQAGSFASTNGWAPVLQKDTGMTVRIVPEDNETQRYRRLTDRRDIAMTSIAGGELRFQIEGLGGYAAVKPAAQYIVWHHNDTPWGYVVSGASDFKTMEDLKRGGVRVVDGVFSPAINLTVRRSLPAYLGIAPEDVDKMLTFVPASSYAENCRAVVEGKADVAYCSPSSSLLSEMEGAPGGIRWLPMPADDTEAWAGYLDFRPDVVPMNIEIGVSSARGVPGLTSNFVYNVRAEEDEELVYNLARWFHRSYDEYKGTHPLAARMSLELFRSYLDRTPFPVHAGTVKYLREIGAWTDADDVWNKEAMERMDQWVQARQAALDEAAKARVKVDFQSEDFLQILRKHTEGLPIFRTRI